MATENAKAKADEADEVRLQREREEHWAKYPRLHEPALFDECYVGAGWGLRRLAAARKGT
jgi:hypothetical protein